MSLCILLIGLTAAVAVFLSNSKTPYTINGIRPGMRLEHLDKSRYTVIPSPLDRYDYIVGADGWRVGVKVSTDAGVVTAVESVENCTLYCDGFRLFSQGDSKKRTLNFLGSASYDPKADGCIQTLPTQEVGVAFVGDRVAFIGLASTDK